MIKAALNILFSGLVASSLAQDLPLMDGYVDYQHRGDAYKEKMAYDRALKAYQKGLRRKPDDQKLLLSAAHTSVILGENEQAQQYFDEVISHEASPDDILSYAEVLAENGKYEEAEKWMGVLEQKGVENERARRRKEGFGKVEVFYEDSLAYFVELAPFNSVSSDFGAIYLDDGVAFLSDRTSSAKTFAPKDSRDETLFLDIFFVRDGDVKRMEGVNNALNEGPATMLDDHTMIVTSNYPESVKNKDSDGVTRLRMLVYKRTGDGWKMKEEFPLNNGSYSVGHPSYDPDHGYLYFSSDMPGGAGQVDLYKIKYKNGQWGQPENLVALNTSGKEVFPFYERRYGELYFSSDGHAGLGGLDIYKTNTKMARILNPGYPVNSSNDDFGVVLDDTGRKGFISSNREGGKGKDDIYTLTIEKVRMQAKVVDEQTGQPLDGEVVVRDTKTGREILTTVANGVIAFEGFEDREYEIIATSEGYDEGSVKVTATEDLDEELVVAVRRAEKPVEASPEEEAESIFVSVSDPVSSIIYKIGNEELELNPSDKGEIFLSVKSIYFASESSEPLALAGLGQLVEVLNSYPYLRVILKGSTDSQGDSDYNLSLAKRRADRVKQEFVKAGIDKDRIKTEALGESGVINKCADDVDCTDEHHAQNRRVDFFID